MPQPATAENEPVPSIDVGFRTRELPQDPSPGPPATREYHDETVVCQGGQARPDGSRVGGSSTPAVVTKHQQVDISASKNAIACAVHAWIRSDSIRMQQGEVFVTHVRRAALRRAHHAAIAPPTAIVTVSTDAARALEGDDHQPTSALAARMPWYFAKSRRCESRSVW